MYHCREIAFDAIKIMLARKLNGCENCDGKAVVTDRMKKTFALVCHDRKYSTLLNSIMYYTADKNPPLLDYYWLYFSSLEQL